MPLSSLSWATVRPYFLEIENSVSPGLTVWKAGVVCSLELALTASVPEGIAAGWLRFASVLAGGFWAITGISPPLFRDSCRLSTIPGRRSASFLILFFDFNAAKRMPYFWEMDHKLSPAWTTWVATSARGRFFSV